MATVLERRLHAETGSANDERAQANRAAAASAAEIVAIIRDSADQHVFTAADATAVMAALHAIRWTHVPAHPDRATLVLPLTRHDPRSSAASRVGKGCVSTCRSRWSPNPLKTKKNN